MPNEFYTSEEFLEYEREEIFRKEWICLGRVDEIPNPGDYFTTELIDEPLLVVRGQDDKVRVLSNVCRHRSSVIAEGKGNSKNFVCPYHAWTYGDNGQLLRAPYMDQVKRFDVKTCRLPAFATETWHGFLYVNLDGKAKPLAPRLKELEPYVRNFHAEQMVHQFINEDVWETNWKCLTENFMEGYHLSVSHINSLHKITPTRLCKKMPGGEGYTAYKSYYNPDYPTRTPYHEDVTDDEKRYSMMFCVYPSHGVALSSSGISYKCLRPRSADQVVLRWGYASFEPKPKAKAITTPTDLLDQIFVEDKERLEALQRGLKSRFSTSNRLGPSDLEGPVWDIFQYMAQKMVPRRAKKPKL
jgi:choline monooxygenase